MLGIVRCVDRGRATPSDVYDSRTSSFPLVSFCMLFSYVINTNKVLNSHWIETTPLHEWSNHKRYYRRKLFT